MTDRKRPLEQAVDLAVYAPLGFVLEARKLLPAFIDRGRAQVQMTKVIGKFAVSQGQVSAERGLAKVQKQAGSVLGELGLRPAGDPSSSGAPPTGAAADSAEGSNGAPVGASAASATGSGSTATAGSVAQSGAGADDLAIPGYDSLAASQVIPRLAGLAPDELAAVARYESAHRARKTILGKISQIQAG